MLVEAGEIEKGEVIDTDLCIIGAGAAGISIARQFSGSQTSVCVLEGGTGADDVASQSLYMSIRNVGRAYPSLYASRTRYFGGSTNCWSGNCMPLRSINFERLPWSEYTGWPITLQELQLYYRRAEAVLGIGGLAFDPSGVAARLGMPLMPFDPRRVETLISCYNPVRFGKVFRKELADAANVRVVLGANVTSIESREDGTRIERVAVRTFGGQDFSVRAKAYVVAAGGIENARLLLASRSVHGTGLGNGRDLVGRFFMTHIWYPSGVILPARPEVRLDLYTMEQPVDGVSCRAHLVLPENVVKDAGIPDFRADLRTSHTLDYDESVRSARVLAESLGHFHWPDRFSEHLARILDHPGNVAAAATGRGGPTVYLLQNIVEQSPNPASRVALSDERDELGMPVAAIDWRLSAIDREGIRQAHDRLAREVGRSGFGRMLIELPRDEDLVLEGADGGAHHMGTTRMHDDPRHGVVDRNCRVHGIGNLFVAGSSVFPTSGFANPTLTIIALAVRLGEHLKASVRGRG